MRISDWSSDVCSSDLRQPRPEAWVTQRRDPARHARPVRGTAAGPGCRRRDRRGARAMSFRSSVPGFGKKLIIEARVNEYMARDVNPNVPFTPDEIAEAAAACREAGASILHYPARHAHRHGHAACRGR